MVIVKKYSQKSVRAGQIKILKDWHLALSTAVAELGKPDFETALVTALSQVIGFDYSVMWAYHANKKPIVLFDTFDAEKKQVLVTKYLEGPYLLDPFYQVSQREISPGIYRINDLSPVHIEHSEYFKTYYKNAKLTDEACFILYPCQNVSVVVSLMRGNSSSAFSLSDTRVMSNVEPVVQQLGKQHWHHIGEQFTGVKESNFERGDLDRVLETFLQDTLPPREREVVSFVLKGYSSVAIASELGLAVATIKAYRRNIHARLGISSQNELFSLFLNAICSHTGIANSNY